MGQPLFKIIVRPASFFLKVIANASPSLYTIDPNIPGMLRQ